MGHIKKFNEFIKEQQVNEYWGPDDDAAQAYYNKKEKDAYDKFERWARMNKGTRAFNDLPTDELGNKVDTQKIKDNTYKWEFVTNTPNGENPNEWFLYTDDTSCSVFDLDNDGFVPIRSNKMYTMDQTIFDDLYTDK